MAELTSEVRDFLSRPLFAVLATINQSGMPQQTVVWYKFQGDRIMMNTLAGRLKERNMLRDPRISLCIVDGYKYVTVRGKAELDTDPEKGQAGIRDLAIFYDGEKSAEEQVRERYSKQERVTIYMSIEGLDVHGV